MANEIDLEYFERGLGLILGQLEYLIEKVGKISYKYVEDLNFRKQQFDAVQNDEEFQKNAAQFSDLRQKIIEDPLFKDDREIFLIVTEIDRLNNLLLILLNDKNGSHSLIQVEKELTEQFKIKIREVLSVNEINNLLDSEAETILKMLVTEDHFKNVQEGMNLVISLTELTEKSKTIFETLAEARIIVIYVDMLKQKID
jgi:hypothetical protein